MIRRVLVPALLALILTAGGAPARAALTIDVPPYQDPLAAWIDAFPLEHMCVGPPLDPSREPCPDLTSPLAEDAATMAAFTKELAVCGGEKIFSASGAWSLGMAALAWGLPITAPYTAPIAMGNAQKESILCVWRALVNVSDLDEESKKTAYELLDTPVQIVDMAKNAAKIRELLSQSKNLPALLHLFELGSATDAAVDGAPVPDAEEYNLWADPVGKLEATLQAAPPAAQACNFSRAQSVLDQGEALVDTFRTDIIARASLFRQAEFQANCLIKRVKENEYNQTPDLYFEMRAEKRLVDFANTWYGAVALWNQGSTGMGRLSTLVYRLDDFKVLVNAWRNSPVPGQVKQILQVFRDRQNAYAEQVRQAKAKMAAGDTMGACGHVQRAYALYGRESETCRGPLLTNAPSGQAALESPSQLSGLLMAAFGDQDAQVAELLRQAQAALSGGSCDPGRGGQLADAALGLLGAMGWYDEAGGTCKTPARLDTAKALKADAEAKIEARAGIDAVLAEGTRLANDLCLYETALTGPRDYLALLETARAGCMEDQARAQYQAIGQLQAKTEARALGIEREVKNLIMEAEALVSTLSSPPGCDVRGAREKLSQARDKFSAIECSGAAFETQSQAYTRAQAINSMLADAEQTVEERLTALTSTAMEYRSLFNELVALTDDTCRFKEAVDPAKLSRLEALAQELCDPAKAQEDRALLEEGVAGVERYMAQDLAQLKQTLADVEKEPACDKAEEMARSALESVGYVTDCPLTDSTREFQSLAERIEQAARKKAEDAGLESERVMNRVKPAVDQCQGSLPQALQALKDLELAAPETCLEPETVAARKQYITILEERERTLASVNALLPKINAVMGNPQCDFTSFDRLMAQARELMKRTDPCSQRQQSYRAAAVSLDQMASNRDTIVQEVAWSDKKLALALAAAQADWTRQTYDDLQAVVSGIGASGHAECLPQYATAQALVAQGPPQEAPMPGPDDGDGIILLQEESGPAILQEGEPIP